MKAEETRRGETRRDETKRNETKRDETRRDGRIKKSRKEDSVESCIEKSRSYEQGPKEKSTFRDRVAPCTDDEDAWEMRKRWLIRRWYPSSVDSYNN
uniref:Uncharacterized protein n=1 Tax=Vespula pensylvanica TaxID=30213 RepID=A0A834UGR0_VESPE|nr:hypothetical protein H0235_000768 [Vespula pensylvanica]